MTEESNLIMIESNQINRVKIYSKTAIWVFSALFAPIFGGVLLRQNLFDNKKKKEGNIVLLISIVFTGLTIIITTIMGRPAFTCLLNMGWGAILSEDFFKKYFPDDNYEYKRIWKALLISIVIIIPFLLAIIYTPTE